MKKTGIIRKPYAKIAYNDFDSKHHREGGMMSYGKADYEKLDKIKYKLAINGMMIDKNSDLWVLQSINRDKRNENIAYVDIYRDGIFYSRSELDILDKPSQRLSGKYLRTRKNKLYMNDIFNNKFIIYEYDYVEKDIAVK